MLLEDDRWQMSCDEKSSKSSTKQTICVCEVKYAQHERETIVIFILENMKNHILFILNCYT